MKENTASCEPDYQYHDCSECGRSTYHDVLAKYYSNVDYESGYPAWEEHQIVRCGGCRSLGFARAWLQDHGLGEGNYGVSKAVRYPQSLSDASSIRELNLLPEIIRNVYIETSRAFINQLPILVGIGLRSIIEAVCKHKKAPGSNLRERIDSLVHTGWITAEGIKVLHHLRFMGNSAAHEVKGHEQRELVAAFAVVDHLLQGVYVVPSKAANLPKAKKKRKRP